MTGDAPYRAHGFLCTRSSPHIHVSPHGLVQLYRECPWHGFKSRKHLLVQLSSMYCTQQEDNNLMYLSTTWTPPLVHHLHTLRPVFCGLHYGLHSGCMETHLTLTDLDMDMDPHTYERRHSCTCCTLRTPWWNCYRTATASELLRSHHNVTGGRFSNRYQSGQSQTPY